MKELFATFPELASWIISGLLTLLSGTLIYFLKQNISALKEVSSVVAEMRISFALQKKEVESTVRDLFKLENRVDSISKDLEEVKIDVSMIKQDSNRSK